MSTASFPKVREGGRGRRAAEARVTQTAHITQLRPSRRKAAASSHEALLSPLLHAPQASGWPGRSRAPLSPCRVQGRSRVEGRRDGEGQGLLGCGGLGATPGGGGGQAGGGGWSGGRAAAGGSSRRSGSGTSAPRSGTGCLGDPGKGVVSSVVTAKIQNIEPLTRCASLRKVRELPKR